VTFRPEDLTTDAFLGGQLEVRQPKAGHRAGIDPVLLAAAVPARSGDSVLELGCGAGVASLCLARRVPGLHITGLEIQPEYAALARQNAEANGLTIEVVEGDLARMPATLRDRCFDHVIANPPYYRRDAGTRAADPGRERSLGEDLSLGTWVAAALRRLKPGGRLTFIQRADRLPDLLAGFERRAASVAVLPLVPRTGREATLVILGAKKGGRAPFRLLPTLVLHAGSSHTRDGDDYDPSVRAVLREGSALLSTPH
jgi:tRNA1Val (adenine37-N6)-methyltransferase